MTERKIIEALYSTMKQGEYIPLIERSMVNQRFEIKGVTFYCLVVTEMSGINNHADDKPHFHVMYYIVNAKKLYSIYQEDNPVSTSVLLTEEKYVGTKHNIPFCSFVKNIITVFTRKPSPNPGFLHLTAWQYMCQIWNDGWSQANNRTIIPNEFYMNEKNVPDYNRLTTISELEWFELIKDKGAIP